MLRRILRMDLRIFIAAAFFMDIRILRIIAIVVGVFGLAMLRSE